ncbi:MAG: hypothetical protein FWE89_06870 [Syntrophaceae bacterium]|nr:hypothetical protein [Syntrophaceae bacterium]
MNVTVMVVVGFLIMLICQDIVALKAMKENRTEGLLCAMIPGYLIIYITKKDPGQSKVLVGWLAGLALFLMGIMR